MTLDHVLKAEVVLADSSFSYQSSRRALRCQRGWCLKVRTEPEPASAVQYSYTFNLGDAASSGNLFKEWQPLISDPTLCRKFTTVFIISLSSPAHPLTPKRNSRRSYPEFSSELSDPKPCKLYIFIELL